MFKSSGAGFTLAEVVLGGMPLTVAIAAILGAYIGQLTLNEHARNLSLAIQDANRVIEQLRQQNSPCAGGTTAPTAVPPTGVWGTNWNLWLDNAAGGGGKSLLPTPAVNELLILTCQNRDGTAACVSGDNPIRVTAAVCWRHRNRTIGECTWNGATLAGADGAVPGPFTIAGVVESPAMLTTLVTCR